ncbi:MAG TPA: mucoidy inhibitor MuiA family protein, partial [Cyclobacteriaceae bacterium]
MKRTWCFLILLAVCATAYSQTDKPVDSKISRITVFLNRAQVTREVKTRVEAGKTNLVLSGLTSQLDQQSIQVSGKGNFVILGISHNQNFLNEFNVPKDLQALKQSLEGDRKQLILEQNQKDILSKEEQLILSNQKIGGGQQNITAAELKAMADFYRTRLTEIGITKVKIDENIKVLNERIVKTTQQFNEKNDLYSRNTSEIVISVSSETGSAAELDVNYVVANAGWYPVYDLRAINTKSPIQLSYKANVYQNTGEEWNNVKLKLSTANPSLGGLKPELYSWYLDFYQPIRVRGYSSVPAARSKSAPEMDKKLEDAEIVMEEAAPAQTSSDFVTTVQTSLNTEFEIGLPYTVQSAAKPTLVDVRNYEMKADYEYSVAPKLDQDAFLLARATGWE